MDSASAKEDVSTLEALARAQHERALHMVGQCAQLGVAEHVAAERKDALDGGRGGCHREEDAGKAAPHAGNLGALERQKSSTFSV
jgi:hypothetical protein